VAVRQMQGLTDFAVEKFNSKVLFSESEERRLQTAEGFVTTQLGA